MTERYMSSHNKSIRASDARSVAILTSLGRRSRSCIRSCGRLRFNRRRGALGLLVLATLVMVVPAEGSRRVSEPIASIGHGAFFDASGQQIVPTQDFVRRAQQWYKELLFEGLQPKNQLAFRDFESRLVNGFEIQGQARLLLQQRLLDWLLQRVPSTLAGPRMRGKIAALQARLQWQLAPSDDPSHLRQLVPFAPDDQTLERLEMADSALKMQTSASLVTTNSGQAYINECIAANVPIPPPIGVLDPTGMAGWRSLGFIPIADQFIVGTPAEVRVFESSDGMCIALPRYSDASLTTVVLDGVICLSKITSKVCLWDNQMNGTVFSFAAGDQIPIGVPDLGIDPAGRYQGGGAELALNMSPGGICTDCHAGENPYIVHPASDLGGLLMGDLGNPPLNLPTFPPDRYDPIVSGSWAQNQLSQAPPFVPAACSGCHSLGGIGGRFPHLSSDLPGYCNIVLAQAINRTMPPGSPGSQAGTQAINDFVAWCNSPPTSGPSNRGDPHLTTVDGVAYDFQSAGEFTSLRNSATGFELQTRQTPVLTTFAPGPNAYTGLASCVSLNTAVAARLGDHRVSLQPAEACDDETLVLFLNGELTNLTGAIDLGGGNRIARIGSSGYEFRASDGTRVLVTDHLWSSQGYFYLNIEVLHTPAREGIMGAIIGTDWLPRAPDGSSFGPRPVDLPTRDFLLNRTFADAWRVSSTTSLFEYAPGTSTATFTDRDWPPPSGTPCDSWEVSHCPRDPVEPLPEAETEAICARFETDEEIFAECLLDVQATGNAQMADALELSLAVRAGDLFADGFESGNTDAWSSTVK